MEVIIIIGLIALNGLLSMSEIALVSARKTKLEAEAKKGSKSAKSAIQLLNEPNRLFSTIQIGITLIGVFNGLYSGEIFAQDLAQIIQKIAVLSPYAYIISKIVIVISVTYITLVFGELVPKRIGMNFAEPIAKIVAQPMLAISRIAHPFVWFLSKSTTLVLNLLRIKGNNKNYITEEEIKALVKEGLDVGEVQEMERNIVERVFNLGDRNVGSIMTHRSELVWLDIADTKNHLKKIIKSRIHDVYPVKSEKKSNIVGIIYLKDLFGKIESDDFSLEELINPPQFLPENTSVYSALKQFKNAHVKYGIVLNEFGDIEGIVTLSDIMEGLIGDIYDLDEETAIVLREDGSWLVDGQYSFYNFLENFKMENLYSKNDYNTLSGLILELLEHIPVAGEK